MGMGAAAGGGGGGGRRRRGRKKAVMSEINITPMVDVMLVLLIIFMVAAPMMTTGVPLDLPSSAAAALPNQVDPVTLDVTADGAMFINEQPITEDTLLAQLTALGVSGEDRLLVRGDASTSYGAFMRVMGLLSAGGFSKVGFVTLPNR